MLNPRRDKHPSHKIKESGRIHTITDALDYAKNVYDLTINNQIISMWKNDLVSGEITISDIVIMIEKIGKDELKKNKDRGDDHEISF